MLNVANTPLAKARDYAMSLWVKGVKGLGKVSTIEEVIPDFDANYMMLQRKLKRALNIPRIQMPVIEPEDMQEFSKRLKEGYIDLFAPYAKGAFQGVPAAWGPMDKEEGEEWVQLGVMDGDPNDDKIMAKLTKVKARSLLPTQNEIWLDKLVINIAKFGVPSEGAFITQQTLIASLEGYILDGHHRFGQVMLVDPSIGMKTLKIGLDIDQLLEVGRAFGAAIGRQPKASLRAQLVRLAHSQPEEVQKKLLPLILKR